MKLFDKDVNPIEPGSLISWYCDDREEGTTWTMYGIVRDIGVIYMGGGIDFGWGIGKILPFEEVAADAEDNDTPYQGITVLGEAFDVTRAIGAYFK